MAADIDPKKLFFFADDLVLDESPTRNFYRQLLQGLIHKNNNMLGVIQGFSSLILMDDDVPPAIQENVKQMKDSAMTSSDLAKGILTTAGCAKVQVEAMDLNEALPYIEKTISELAASRGVSCQVNRAPNLPAVMADSTRFNEALQELGKNAVQAAADAGGGNGEVAIDVLAPGDASPAEENRVDIFIRNTSDEIPYEKIVELFVPFYSSRGNEHLGIGLTTAAILCGQMGIRLGFRNGEGTTTVWLSLPTAS